MFTTWYIWGIFSTNKISDNRERSRREISAKLKNDISRGDKPEYERRIYIHLPKEDQHKKHVIGEVCLQLQLSQKASFHKSDLLCNI